MDICKIRVDLSQEAQDEINGKYKTAMIDIASHAKALVEELQEISERCQEQQLKISIDYFVEFYNTTLLGVIKRVAYEWRESDASICSALKIVKNNNDDALRTATNFENRLCETAQIMFAAELESLSHLTKNPNFSARDVEECAEKVQRYLNQIEEIREDIEIDFYEKAQYNALYSVVLVLVDETIRQVQVAFEKAKENFNAICEQMQIDIPKIGKKGEVRKIENREREDYVNPVYKDIIIQMGF